MPRGQWLRHDGLGRHAGAIAGKGGRDHPPGRYGRRGEAGLSAACEASDLPVHERRLSHVDSFDPKPMLDKYDGQPLPGGTIKTERRTGELMKSPFKFKKYGQCGMDVSELWPHLGEVADDICWVRSVYTDIPNHEPSCLMVNTGANQAGRPSMGAWLTYGLGTENQNLPGFMVLCPDVPTTVGPPLWRTDSCRRSTRALISRTKYRLPRTRAAGSDGARGRRREKIRTRSKRSRSRRGSTRRS